MVDLTFLKIQILNRPQIRKFFPSLCTGQEEENGVRTSDEESCGDAQDLSSPDEEDNPLLSNYHGFTGIFSNFEAII